MEITSGRTLNRMVFQCPTLILLLGTVFLFENAFCYCEGPSWANTAWDTTQDATQDLEQMSTKQQPNCLHNSMCHICHCIAGLRLSKENLEMLYTSCKVVLVIVVCLSLHYISLKVTRNTKPSQEMIQSHASVSITREGSKEHNQNMDKMITKLVSNTSKMMKYMKLVAHRHRKEVKYYKASKRRRGKNEIDEDEQLFQVCPNTHSSCGETSMY